MSNKGSNGLMDGREHVEVFRSWVVQVDDFKPFVRQGALSKSRVAKEAGLLRDVLYTNPEIRDVLWPELVARLEEEGVLQARVAQPADVVPRSQLRSSLGDARVKQIHEENEALKAENRVLRKQLDRLSGMDEILRTTGRLPW